MGDGTHLKRSGALEEAGHASKPQGKNVEGCLASAARDDGEASSGHPDVISALARSRLLDSRSKMGCRASGVCVFVVCRFPGGARLVLVPTASHLGRMCCAAAIPARALLLRAGGGQRSTVGRAIRGFCATRWWGGGHWQVQRGGGVGNWGVWWWWWCCWWAGEFHITLPSGAGGRRERAPCVRERALGRSGVRQAELSPRAAKPLPGGGRERHACGSPPMCSEKGALVVGPPTRGEEHRLSMGRAPGRQLVLQGMCCWRLRVSMDTVVSVWCEGLKKNSGQPQQSRSRELGHNTARKSRGGRQATTGSIRRLRSLGASTLRCSGRWYTWWWQRVVRRRERPASVAHSHGSLWGRAAKR